MNNSTHSLTTIRKFSQKRSIKENFERSSPRHAKTEALDVWNESDRGGGEEGKPKKENRRKKGRLSGYLVTTGLASTFRLSQGYASKGRIEEEPATEGEDRKRGEVWRRGWREGEERTRRERERSERRRGGKKQRVKKRGGWFSRECTLHRTIGRCYTVPRGILVIRSFSQVCLSIFACLYKHASCPHVVLYTLSFVNIQKGNNFRKGRVVLGDNQRRECFACCLLMGVTSSFFSFFYGIKESMVGKDSFESCKNFLEFFGVVAMFFN